MNPAEIETLVFAGGGNRCWWQAGVMSRWVNNIGCLPRQLVGTSAGAAIAASCLTDGPDAALEACIRLYAENTSLFNWRALANLKFRFAHEHIYPAWIRAIVNTSNFHALRSSTVQLRVALTRPARLLGVSGTLIAGTLAYMIDKYIWNSIHPSLPRWLGLRQEFLSLSQCQTAGEVQALLIAAAAAAPFLQPRNAGGGPAIDGGYTDSAPIPEQTPPEKARTLVLLTRHYPALPPAFRWRDRNYWQPSRAVPVSTWDCTTKTSVREAFILGEYDAEDLMECREIRKTGDRP